MRPLIRSLSLMTVGLLAGISASPQRLHAQNATPLAPGVTQVLAEERARRVSDLRYDLLFTVPERRTERVNGRATISFVLAEPNAPLALDFEPGGTPAVSNLSINGAAQSAEVRDGHIVLPASRLRAGANRVTLDFVAGDTPLNRNEEFLYTIFVPARAHEAFPSFDQPDLKARWTLTLDVPEGWTTLGNGKENSRHTANGRARVGFAETEPLSSYLFAFAAGRFSVLEAERNGRTFRILHRETDAAKVARNRDALFDLHASSLEWMERYTNIPYPFGKFDMLLVPAFQFGGMEHAGAVFYSATAMMLEESATQDDMLGRASTIAHETAHMWFGDLVTMRWFTDVWMKEVFANFMAAKIVNPAFPAINHELRFLYAHYPAAYGVDRTEGTNAIRQPLDNLKNAGQLYGAIIYQKAPIVMRQLESMIGEEAFRDGLREYLRTYGFKNASWSDLISILDAKTPVDLSAWSRAWVEERGRPIVRTSIEVRDGRIDRLTFSQSDPFPARGLTWTQEAQVVLGYDDRLQTLPVRLEGAATSVAAATGLPAPRFVLLNGGGRAYGELRLDAASLEWLSTHVPDIADPLTRGAAWITLWDAMLSRDLAPVRLLDLAIAALPRETDQLNVERILTYLNQTFWRFLPDTERQARGPAIETVLRRGLANAATVSLRSSYFSTLRDVATTRDTVDWLTRVWRHETTVEGLPLAETDDIALAKELVVREVDGWRRILDEQITRTQNPDRKARLQFVAPALSADPAERDRFFASLSTLENRRREPWVLDGLGYLHHPLRARQSIKYIRPSLDLLQEIQQTGDIFFPTNWTSTVLGGHRSAEAAQIVRGFLQSAGPAYPERLRRTILSAGDTLFRASVIN